MKSSSPKNVRVNCITVGILPLELWEWINNLCEIENIKINLIKQETPCALKYENVNIYINRISKK